MPFTTFPGVYRLRVYCTYQQQTSINVAYLQVAAITGTGATEQQVVDAYSTLFGLDYPPLLNTAAVYYGCDLGRIDPLPLTVPVTSRLGSGPGIAAGAPMPMQIAGVVKLRSFFAGRKERGRKYSGFPAVSLSAGNPQRPTVAAVGLLQTWGNDFANPLIAGAVGAQSTMQPVLWHRVTRLYTVIRQALADPFWGTQRRRGDFGRPNTPPF